MLTDEQLEKLYIEEFAALTSFEEISNRLLTMKNTHVDELRKTFVNELLYSISIGYTRYDKPNEERDKAISLFCQNVSRLPEKYFYFRAVGAFFLHDYDKSLLLIEQHLQSLTTKYSETIDEYILVDNFFEPFKEAFPRFWTALSAIIAKYQHNPSVPILCITIDEYYHCKTDEDALELLLDAHQKCPDSILLKELIGHTYYSMKMWHNAVAYFELVEDNRLFFRNDDIFFMMAWCYGKAKDYKLEESFYREALSDNPENVDILNNMGYSFYIQKRYTH